MREVRQKAIVFLALGLLASLGISIGRPAFPLIPEVQQPEAAFITSWIQGPQTGQIPQVCLSMGRASSAVTATRRLHFPTHELAETRVADPTSALPALVSLLSWTYRLPRIVFVGSALTRAPPCQ